MYCTVSTLHFPQWPSKFPKLVSQSWSPSNCKDRTSVLMSFKLRSKSGFDRKLAKPTWQFTCPVNPLWHTCVYLCLPYVQQNIFFITCWTKALPGTIHVYSFKNQRLKYLENLSEDYTIPLYIDVDMKWTMANWSLFGTGEFHTGNTSQVW